MENGKELLKNSEGINVLSLFDGMSCGQIALERAGIKVKNYFASEIDKYAITVAMANYPNTIQLGDVRNVKASDLPSIDLIIGGSPCQGFSFAGKGLNFDDPRSALFFEFVRLKNELKPKWFFLENVRMEYKHELVISRYMGIEPIIINSALLSAQNRVRLYWTNIGAKPQGLFSEMYCMIPQPKDKGILLKDILEKEVPEKYYLREKALQKIDRRKWSIPKIDPEKTGTILTKNNSGQLSIDSGTTLIKCVAMRGRNPENPTSREAGINTEQMIEPRQDEKTNCLTSVQKDNLVFMGADFRYDEGLRIRDEEKSVTLSLGGGIGGVGMVAGINEKSPCLHGFEQGTNGQFNRQLGMLRRLTELECERLQTVSDNYTNHVSSTQRYKMLGNGWTVDVIAYIFEYLKREEFFNNSLNEQPL